MGAGPSTSPTVSAATTTVTIAPAASPTSVTTAAASTTTVATTSATTSTADDSEAVNDAEDDYDYGGYDDGPAATTLPAPTGAGSATTLPAATSAGVGATVTVGAEDFAFSPATLTIEAGDTVQWELRDGSHTTTSGDPPTGDGLWNEVITVDIPVSIPFDEPGEFRFFCRFHPDAMQGTIVVQA